MVKMGKSGAKNKFKNRFSKSKDFHQRECQECGESFLLGVNSNLPKFCCHKCRRSFNSRVKNQKGRVKRKRDYIQDINPRILFKRDKGICQICRKKIDINKKWPDMESATIDHIITLHNGGKNSYENVQLTCLRCNDQRNRDDQMEQNK